MREIVILSGKGGTGKTSLTAAFAHLAEDKVVCDLDVDAPDLHILLEPRVVRREEFWSGHEAVIDPESCQDCGLCEELCRFGAVVRTNDRPTVNPLRCEGCKVCVALCPAGAIAFPERLCGQWYLSESRMGPMVHAQLGPGQENSGRLVTLLKNQARELAKKRGLGLILSDGAPGVACPVISSLAGADLAVIVTEPTPSGRHDFERAAGVCDHFRIKVAVIVNKWDINPAQTEGVKEVCRQRGYAHVADLPFDRFVTEAMTARRAVTEFPDAPLARDLRRAWERVQELAGIPDASSGPGRDAANKETNL